MSAFTEEAATLTSQLRGSLADVVAAFPEPIRDRSSLQRATKLGRTVSWAIYRAATTTSPLAAGLYVPKREAMSKFLRVARKLGVPEEKVRVAESRFGDFERFVEEQAGDWDSFEMMLADLVGERADTTELKQRRAAYRANRHLWGAQIACLFTSSIVGPLADHRSNTDYVAIGGCIGIRQLRKRTRVLFRTRWRVSGPDGADTRPPEPLIPSDLGMPGAGFLPDLCSSPFPEVDIRDTARGYRELMMLSRDLGANADVDYAIARVFRDRIARTTPTDPTTFALSVTGPSRVLLRDLVIHESALEGCRVTVKAYGSDPNTDVLELDDTRLLPDQPEITHIGTGLLATTSTDCPKLDRAVALAMQHMGWNPDEFHVYRCRIEYPVLSSVVRTFVSKHQ